MGLFDWITGNKAPDPNVPRRSTDELRQALLGLNKDDQPWTVAPDAEQPDRLVAEWKIVDAKWSPLFAKAGMTRTFRVIMRFVEETSTVRSVDQEVEVQWIAGIPRIQFHAEYFRGQKIEISGGIGFGRKESGELGELYRYKFSTNEIKEPLRKVVAESGWGWHGVAFTKL